MSRIKNNKHKSIAQNWNMNANLSNLHTKSWFPWLYVSFLCSLTFSAHHFFIFMLMLFFLLLLFPQSALAYLRLLSQMLRLQFHVNQRRLKHHHWSTSFWLTAPPLANQSKRGGDVTLKCLISCRCSAFTCTGENGLLSAGQHLSIQDTVICGHLSLLYVFLAIR